MSSAGLHTHLHKCPFSSCAPLPRTGWGSCCLIVPPLRLEDQGPSYQLRPTPTGCWRGRGAGGRRRDFRSAVIRS